MASEQQNKEKLIENTEVLIIFHFRYKLKLYHITSKLMLALSMKLMTNYQCKI